MHGRRAPSPPCPHAAILPKAGHLMQRVTAAGITGRDDKLQHTANPWLRLNQGHCDSRLVTPARPPAPPAGPWARDTARPHTPQNTYFTIDLCDAASTWICESWRSARRPPPPLVLVLASCFVDPRGVQDYYHNYRQKYQECVSPGHCILL